MEEPQPLPEVDAAPKTKGKSKLVKILLIAVIVLGAAGGGAWWFLGGSAQAEESDPSTRGILAFDPFLVNLADNGGSRFLKVTIQIVMPSEKEAARLKETPALYLAARSAILELLTQQTSLSLVTAEGKQSLKNAIKERLRTVPGDLKVVDVLFTEFVVQF